MRKFYSAVKGFTLVCLLFVLVNTAFGQIALKGFTKNTSTSSSIVISTPSGVVAGDVMIVNITQSKTSSSGGVLINPTLIGWTLIDGRSITSSGNSQCYAAVLYKVATGTEPSSYTFALTSNANSNAGGIIAFSGVDVTGGVTANGAAGGPFDVVPGTINFNTSNSTTVTATSLTTISANAAILMLAQAQNNSTFNSINWQTATSPGSLTEIYELNNNAGYQVTSGAAWALKPTIGSTGNGTASISNSGRNGGILIALKASSITTGTISPLTYCAGIAPVGVSIPFTSTGTFTSGNTYTAQLSSSTGIFPGISIGTLLSNSNSGTISGTIPAGTAAGTGYLIQVISSTPAVTGSNNGSNITINNPAAPTGAATQAFCISTSPTIASLSATGAGIQWYAALSGGSALATTTALANANHYYASQTVSGCEGSARLDVTVTLNAAPSISGQPSTATPGYCLNATATALSVSASGAVPSYQWYSNTTASNSGGTTVGTNSLNYTPLTTTAGVLYYYCVVGGTCSPAATSAVSGAITVNTLPTSVTASGSGTFCGSTTITAANGSDGVIYFQGTNSNGTSTATASASQVVSVSGTYYFRAQSAAGCWGTQGSVTVTINIVPTAVTASGSGTFCGSTTITATGGSGGTIYFQGTTSGGTSTSTPSSSQIISTSGTYYFRAQSSSGCWSTEGSVTVTINALPTSVTASGSGTFCGSTTITAANSSDGIIYYQGTNSNGTSTATASASQVVSVSGTYYFRAQSAAGCWGTQGSVTVTINIVPAAATASGGGTYCGSTTITASGGSGGTVYYQGTTSGGTSTSTSSTSQVVSSSGTYYFRARSSSGCWSTEGSVTVTINALPTTVTASGGGTYCGSTTITAANGSDGIIYYQGTNSNGTSTATASTTQLITVSGTYYFRAQSSLGCWGAQGSVTVTINTVPTAVTASGGGTFCGSTTITATGGSGGTVYYQGTTSGGTSTSTSSTSQVVSSSGTYYFRARSSSGCWSTEGSVTVTINALPTTVTASGGGTYCGSTTITAANGSDGIIYYQGTNSNGTSTATASTTQLITVSGTYYFRAQSSLGCWGAQGSVTVTINTVPTAVTASGGGTFCGSTTITATGGSGGTVYYQGTTSGGTSTSTSSTSQVVSASGIYYFRAQSSSGCWGTEGSVTVTINALPTAVTASGTGTYCGSTTITAANGSSGTIYYQGTTSGGTSTLISSTSQLILTSGTYYFRAQSAAGCWATEGSATVTINPLPTGTLTATETSGTTNNDNTICTGAPVIFTATSGYNSYIFKVAGAITQTGTSNVFTSNTLNNGDAVTVDVANGFNCGATFGPVTITVKPLPTPTLISDKTSICPGDMVTFTAGGGNNYGFKINGSSVQAGSSTVFTSTSLNNNDKVTVDVTNTNGCTASAGPIAITVNALPTGSLSASATTICAGSNITFTASAGFAFYEFKVNGTTVQAPSSSITFSSTAITNSQVVTVVVTNTGGCSVTFSPVSITVNPLPTGTFTATENSGTPNDNTICSGTPVTFTFSNTSYSNYAFKINGTSKQASTSNTFITSALASGDIVTVDVTTSAGCTTTFTATSITVAPQPSGTLTQNPSTAICAGDNVTFTATSGFTNYNFKVGGTTVQSGSTNTYSSTALANGNQVTVEVTNSSACIATFNTLTVSINPLPTGTVVAVETSGLTNNDGIICTGATVVFTPPAGFSNYNFILNNVQVQNGTTNTYTNSNLSNGDKLQVAVTNSNGCIAFLNTITVVVNPLPSISAITGTSTVCVNSTTALADATTGGVWTSVNPAIATVNSTGVVTGISAGVATIVYTTAANVNGCTNTTSQSVTVNPIPVVPAITGSFEVCIGNTTQLNNVTPSGVWSSSDGTVATINTTGLVSGISAGTVVISYTVTNSVGCITTVTQTITVHPLPGVASITYTSPATSFSVCVGNTITLADATIGGSWSSSNTGIATINASGVLTGVADGTVTISYTVTNSFGCITTVTQSVIVHALPVVTLSGPNPICPYQNNTYTTEAGQSNYTWTYTGGTKGAGGGLTDNYITIFWNGSGARTVYVNYTNSYGCSGATSKTLTTSYGTVPTLSGTTPLCLNSNGTYSTQPGYSAYTWSASGGTITPGTSPNDNTATVNWTSAGSQTVSVNFTDQNGCVAASPTVFSVTVNPIPTVVTHAQSTCSPATVDLTLAAVTAGSTTGLTYTYFTDAAGTNTYTTPTTATAGTYYIKGTTAAGCSSTVQSVTVTVNPTPIVKTVNPAAVCSPATVDLTAAGVTAGSTSGLTYTYFTDATGTNAYTNYATATAGTYYIKGTTAAGCSNIQSVLVTVNPLPTATISGSTTVCLNTTATLITFTGAGATAPYTFTYNINGSSNTTLSTTTGNSITITAPTNTAGTFNYNLVSVKDASVSACSQAQPSTVTVMVNPVSVGGTVTTAATVCSGTNSATLNLNGQTGAVLRWEFSVDGGTTWSAIANTTTSYTYTNITQTTQYRAVVQSGVCSVINSSAAIITVNTASVGGTVATSTSVCSGSNSATLNLTGQTGVVVRWEFSTNGGLNWSAIANTTTAYTYTNLTQTTQYRAVVQNGVCAANNSSVATITVNPLPVVTAGSAACVGSTLAITPATGGTWISNNTAVATITNGGIVTGVGAGSVTFTFTQTSTGCSSTTSSVTINAQPAAPTITPSTATICQQSIQPLSSGTTPISGSVTVSSGNISATNGSIPDNSNTGVANAIVVSGIPAGAVINSVSVNFNITHPYDADLILNLKAPNNNVLNLVNQKGGSGHDFRNTVVSSTGITPFTTSNSGPPFTGIYKADASNSGVGATNNTSNVTAFTSLFDTPNGNWIFSARDAGPADVGTINNWSITINYTLTSVSQPVTWTPITDLFTNASGTAPYIAGTSLSVVYVKPATIGNKIYTATSTNAAGCTNSTNVNLTVNPVPVVTISSDYCVAPGKVRLTATSVPSSGVTFVWSAGQTTSFIDVDIAGQYYVVATLPTGCTGTAIINVAQELVVNGDFSSGNTGFTSDYAYIADGAGNNELVDDSGNNGYSITTNGQNVHPNFWGQDHTGNTIGIRNFMAVNGHGNTLVVWKETVKVLPNTTYYFSAWAMSMNSAGNNAKLQFSVNGTNTGTTAALSNHGESTGATDNWTRFYGTWISGPTTTSASIYINDLEPSLGGNDFGLDDISFGTLSTFISLASAPGTDAQTVCRNTAITNIVYNVGNGNTYGPTVSGLPSGVTSVFAGSQLTISGTPTVAGGVYPYTITTTGCNPVSASGTITVQEATINLTNGANSPTICTNTNVNFAYTFGGTATGATVTGLPSGVTANTSGNTVTISGTTAVAGSYPYTITTTGGTCGQQATVGGTIIFQAATIALTSAAVTTSQTPCINTPLTNIQYTVGGTATGATVSGLPPGVTGTFNSGIFIISGTPTNAVNSPYNYTVSTTGSCAVVTATGTITVAPAAGITLSSANGTDAQTVCNNSSIIPITYGISNATNASITSGALPAGVGGAFNSGVFTISGTPSPGVSGTFSYTITTSGGCASATITGSITLQAQTISLTSGVASPSVCNNAAMSAITYTIGGTATGATLSGAPAGVTGALVGNIFTISGTPNDAIGGYNYTIKTSGTSCAQVTIGGTITIQAAATGGTLLSTVSICSGGNGTLTLSGQTGTIQHWEYSTNGGTSWTSIANASITLTYTNVTVSTSYRVVVGNGCGNVNSSIALVGIHNYWTGAVSNDWNTGGNWADGLVPSTSCPDVTIPAVTTNNPVVSTSTLAITNLIIKPNASLIVSGSGILQIAGTITNTGIFDVSNGSLDFNGVSAQSFSGSLFVGNTLKNLIVSNASGLTVSGSGIPLNITGVLGFGNVSNANLITGENIVLISSASGTAMVGDITNNGVNFGNHFTGKVAVERYYPARRAWRLVTAPLSGTGYVFDTWQIGGTYTPGRGTYVSGPVANLAANGLDLSPLNNTSLRVGTELTTVGNTRTELLSTNTGTTDNKGFFIFVRGDRLPGPTLFDAVSSNNTTLSSKGTLQTGDQQFAATATYGGHTLIGNPYASPVDFAKLTLNNLNKKFYVFDPNINTQQGAYVTMLETSPNSGIYYGTPNRPGGQTGIIQSSQAFFVETSGVSPSILFTEKSKSSINNLSLFRPMNPTVSQSFRTNLYLIDNNGNTVLADGNLAKFDNSYNAGVDLEDALKFGNVYETFGILSGKTSLAVSFRPVLTKEDTIYYKFSRAKQLKYQFEFEADNLEQDNLAGFIEDKFLNKATPINMNGTTRFYFEGTPDAASTAVDRFKVVFKPSVIYTSLTANVLNSDIAVEWNVASETNIKGYDIERSADGVHFTKVSDKACSGNNATPVGYNWLDVSPALGYYYYRIRSISNNNVTGYSNVVKVKLNKGIPAIYVFPNPVTENIIHLQMNSIPKGVYGTRLINNLGQVLGTSYIDHLAGTGTETIEPNTRLLSGIYQLEITAPDKKTITIKVFVK